MSFNDVLVWPSQSLAPLADGTVASASEFTSMSFEDWLRLVKGFTLRADDDGGAPKWFDPQQGQAVRLGDETVDYSLRTEYGRRAETFKGIAYVHSDGSPAEVAAFNPVYGPIAAKYAKDFVRDTAGAWWMPAEAQGEFSHAAGIDVQGHGDAIAAFSSTIGLAMGVSGLINAVGGFGYPSLFSELTAQAPAPVFDAIPTPSLDVGASSATAGGEASFSAAQSFPYTGPLASDVQGIPLPPWTPGTPAWPSYEQLTGSPATPSTPSAVNSTPSSFNALDAEDAELGTFMGQNLGNTVVTTAGAAGSGASTLASALGTVGTAAGAIGAVATAAGALGGGSSSTPALGATGAAAGGALGGTAGAAGGPLTAVSGSTWLTLFVIVSVLGVSVVALSERKKKRRK